MFTERQQGLLLKSLELLATRLQDGDLWEKSGVLPQELWLLCQKITGKATPSEEAAVNALIETAAMMHKIANNPAYQKGNTND